MYGSPNQSERWDSDDYGQIVWARCADDRHCAVTFADGDSVRFDLADLLPKATELDEVDWWRTAANEFELIVPIGREWFEIPWDVIRRHTDPAYEAHWADMTERCLRRRGERIRSLREERQISVEQLAARLGLATGMLRDLEAGAVDPWFDASPVLEAMGCTIDDLATDRADLTAEVPHAR